MNANRRLEHKIAIECVRMRGIGVISLFLALGLTVSALV